MISCAIGDDIKTAQVVSQRWFIIGVNLNCADATAAEFPGQYLRARQICVGNDYLFKVAGAREIASRFRPHRATAAQDDDPHNLTNPFSCLWTNRMDTSMV